MEPIGLGKLIEGNVGRDAIHIAVAPVVAHERLAPGQDIGIVSGDRVGHFGVEKHIGIVDPFLRSMIFPEQRFYMLLYPNTITSLRHEWSHPEFPAMPVGDEAHDKTLAQSASEQWLRNEAERIDQTYSNLIDAARDWLTCEKYLVGDGAMEGESTPPEFWEHYQRVTGEVVPRYQQQSFYSCSC